MNTSSSFRLVGLISCTWNLLFKEKRFYLFLERGDGRENEGERNINVKEKHHSVAFCKHLDQGPHLQPRHVPDWEPNQGPFPFRTTPNQLHHTSQGWSLLLNSPHGLFNQPSAHAALPITTWPVTCLFVVVSSLYFHVGRACVWVAAMFSKGIC